MELEPELEPIQADGHVASSVFAAFTGSAVELAQEQPKQQQESSAEEAAAVESSLMAADFGAAAPAAAKAEVLLIFDGSISSPERSAEQRRAVDAIKAAVVEFLFVQLEEIDVRVSADDAPQLPSSGDRLTIAMKISDRDTLHHANEWEDEEELRTTVAGLLMTGVTADSIIVTIEAGSVRLTVGGLPP